MSIVRTKHQKNYVVLNKTALEDKRLSFKAKGLWAYCMSLPDDWDFHVNHLATVSKDGVDAVYSALKELIDCDYAEKIQPNVGKFGKVEYFIYETPEFKKSLPQTDFPFTEVPHTENPPLLSTNPKPSTKEEVVCYSEAESSKKSQECKEKIIEQSLELQEVLEKTNTKGQTLKINLKDVFYHSIKSKKDWDTTEIHEAWKILQDYVGYVNDGILFIAGTIKNLRNKAKSEYLSKGKQCSNPQQTPFLEPKKNSSDQDTQDHRSVGAILQEMGWTSPIG